jgi:hypothetical protein
MWEVLLLLLSLTIISSRWLHAEVTAYTALWRRGRVPSWSLAFFGKFLIFRVILEIRRLSHLVKKSLRERLWSWKRRIDEEEKEEGPLWMGSCGIPLTAVTHSHSSPVSSESEKSSSSLSMLDRLYGVISRGIVSRFLWIIDSVSQRVISHTRHAVGASMGADAMDSYYFNGFSPSGDIVIIRLARRNGRWAEAWIALKDSSSQCILQVFLSLLLLSSLE